MGAMIQLHTELLEMQQVFQLQTDGRKDRRQQPQRPTTDWHTYYWENVWKKKADSLIHPV